MRLFLFINLLTLIYAKVITQVWVVTEGKIAPDNFGMHGILINGQFPGPTITAAAGDTIMVTVVNMLKKNFSIHWHGITQHGTPDADGVPFVTQNPIKPMSMFVYKFNVYDQTGTYWYHAHTDMDAEHAYGALIIQDKKEVWDDIVKFNPKYQYDEERVIMLSEMWHNSTENLMKGLTQQPFLFPGPTQSILTNGKNYAEWGTTPSSDYKFNLGYDVVNVKPNKRYRLRIIGANGFSLFTFRIPGHKFTLIEADGTIIDPLEVDRVELSSGQRYSVIMATDQKVDNYYMYTQITDATYIPDNGVAILHYEGAKSTADLIRKQVKPPPLNDPLTRWEEKNIVTSKWYNKGLSGHYYPVPKRVNKVFNLTVTLRKVDGLSKWLVNDVVDKPRTSTLLYDMRMGTYKPQPGVYDIQEGDDVQLVIQHTMPTGRVCGTHPWHLHGHSFYVVGSGNGFYNPAVDGPAIDNYLDTTPNIPIFRDTYTHFINTVPYPSNVTSKAIIPQGMPDLNDAPDASSRMDASDEPCGWYAVRFKANNPGSWFIHCHMSPHIIMGKVAIINYVPKK